jgi:hypothetical protein
MIQEIYLPNGLYKNMLLYPPIDIKHLPAFTSIHLLTRAYCSPKAVVFQDLPR